MKTNLKAPSEVTLKYLKDLETLNWSGMKGNPLKNVKEARQSTTKVENIEVNSFTWRNSRVIDRPSLVSYGRQERFKGLYIPSISDMRLSTKELDHLNPNYLPKDYFEGKGPKGWSKGSGPRYERPTPNEIIEELIRVEIKKVDRTIHLLGIKESNKMNRYLHRQWKRLFLLREEDPKKFFELASKLLKYSGLFRLAALHYIEPHWYRRYIGWNAFLSGVKDIAQSEATDYRVKDYYVTKPECEYVPYSKNLDTSKLRLISAPTLTWRVYLCQVNTILSIFADPHLSHKQHGHRKGYGVGSAWNQIFSRKLWKMPFILEFDFKGFHPSISYDLIRRSLAAINVPSKWIDFIIALNSPTVVEPNGSVRKSTHGVPQGVSLSAILGILVLQYLNVYSRKLGQYVGFADDGVIFSKKDPLPALKECIKETGIELKDSKTQLVKRQGKWLNSLKFLGCILNPEPKGLEFYASTRSGNNAVITWCKLNWKSATKLSLVNHLLGKIFCADSKPANQLTNDYEDGSHGDHAQRISASNINNWSSYAVLHLASLIENSKRRRSFPNLKKKKSVLYSEIN